MYNRIIILVDQNVMGTLHARWAKLAVSTPHLSWFQWKYTLNITFKPISHLTNEQKNINKNSNACLLFLSHCPRLPMAVLTFPKISRTHHSDCLVACRHSNNSHHPKSRNHQKSPNGNNARRKTCLDIENQRCQGIGYGVVYVSNKHRSHEESSCLFRCGWWV